MIDRIGAAAAAALFVVLASGCTDGIPAQTDVPASAEPFDLGFLKGKIIRVEALNSSTITPRTRDDIRVIGTTIVWNGPWYDSECVLNGRPERDPFGDRMAILFTPGQPKSDVKIPCEASKDLSGHQHSESEPALVVYSTTMALQGNVLELSGELREHNVRKYEASQVYSSLEANTVTHDISEHLHARFRLSADKCQILDFSRSKEVVEINSIHVNRPKTDTWSERAISCAIVVAPS